MPTIKNSLIAALIQNGLLQTTEHDVPVADAYKAFKFRSAVEKANKEIEEKCQGLVKSVGIENGSVFDARLKELGSIEDPTEKQKEELADMQEKLAKFNNLYRELMNDETELEGVKSMPYESFHALANENRALIVPGRERPIDIFSIFATELENVLWVAPENS